MWKSSGGNRTWQVQRHVFYTNFRRRWFVLRDSFIGYYQGSESDDNELRGCLLVDGHFSVRRGQRSNQLTIENSYRKIELRCASEREADEWFDAILVIRVFLQSLFKCDFAQIP